MGGWEEETYVPVAGGALALVVEVNQGGHHIRQILEKQPRGLLHGFLVLFSISSSSSSSSSAFFLPNQGVEATFEGIRSLEVRHDLGPKVRVVDVHVRRRRACFMGWVGGWVGGLDRGDRGGSNELLWVFYGWVGGLVGRDSLPCWEVKARLRNAPAFLVSQEAVFPGASRLTRCVLSFMILSMSSSQNSYRRVVGGWVGGGDAGGLNELL